MKKLILLFVIAFAGASANAQVKQEPAKKVIDQATKQKAKEVRETVTLKAVAQKRKRAGVHNLKKNN